MGSLFLQVKLISQTPEVSGTVDINRTRIVFNGIWPKVTASSNYGNPHQVLIHLVHPLVNDQIQKVLSSRVQQVEIHKSV